VENATGIQPTLASIQQHVFGPICSSCHYSYGGSIPALDSAEISYAELVNVESYFCSNGVGGWAKRVEPYQPDGSCLVMVLEGAQGAGGLFMPPSPMRPLSRDQIDAIREWIARGANP
jgi:mono/diheme cytochrome c family protein